MIGVAIGLLGALLIAWSDTLSRVTTRHFPLPLLLSAVFVLSIPPIYAGVLLLGGVPDLPETAREQSAYGQAILSGILNIIGLAALYLALSRGPVALAAPATASFSVLLILFNALAGEPVTAVQGAAILLVFAGIAMLAQPERGAHRGPRAGASEAVVPEAVGDLAATLTLALIAATAVALRMFLAQEATEVLGSGETLLITRLTAAVGALLWLAVATSLSSAPPTPRRFEKSPRSSLRVHAIPRAVWGLALLQAVLEATALGAFLLAGTVEDGGRIGAAIGFAAFAALTPLLGWLTFGDRIGARRVLWIAVVMAGAALGALGAPASEH